MDFGFCVTFRIDWKRENTSFKAQSGNYESNFALERFDKIFDAEKDKIQSFKLDFSYNKDKKIDFSYEYDGYWWDSTIFKRMNGEKRTIEIKLSTNGFSFRQPENFREQEDLTDWYSLTLEHEKYFPSINSYLEEVYNNAFAGESLYVMFYYDHEARFDVSIDDGKPLSQRHQMVISFENKYPALSFNDNRNRPLARKYGKMDKDPVNSLKI